MSNIPEKWLPLYGEFCRYIHRQVCDVCGRNDPEVAHLDAVAGKRLPGRTPTRLRSRQGIALFAAMPLCAECHREGAQSYHAIGQAAFAELHFGNEANMFGLAMKHQLLFFIGEYLEH